MLSKILPRGSRRRGVVKKVLSPKVPTQISKKYRIIDQAGFAALESALRREFFTGRPSDYLETEQGRHDLRVHLFTRLEKARKQVVPWLSHAKPLAGANVLEIGCGTGSDTVAFAEQGARVTAIDVDEKSLKLGEDRCDLYGLNVTFLKANATEVHRLLRGEDFDFIIFYAVLQHMTHQERMVAMKSTWNMLAPGTLWCVVDTPNRLWYCDSHTAKLPFFHWLPDDLAFQYTRFSPRTYFRELYREGNEANMLHFLSRGRGVSFHEFELSIKRVDKLDVVSSMSMFYRQRNIPTFLRWRFSIGYRHESLMARICPQVHRGFFQRDLDLIIAKD